MPDEASREEMVQTVFKQALALCFKSEERYLTEDQIIARRLTPTADYSRACLRRLIEGQAIEHEWVESGSPLSEKEKTMYIKNPIGDEIHRIFNFEMSKKLLEFVKADRGNELYILSLRIEILAHDCIAYIQFYAAKSKLNITNYEANNAKLKLMLMELKLENVYALLWRSIKMKQNRVHPNASVNFAEIIENAFEKYSNSSNKDDLEEYKRPAQIKASMISRIAEKILPALPRISRIRLPR
ncbi:hypothetical protein [Cellvibrio sp. UBA7671]|uniref:hypothetical protein n=1 Tax=Cellvibrio sp. UBA7671 TaxID=1946312 RepID=UPI002F35F83D